MGRNRLTEHFQVLMLVTFSITCMSSVSLAASYYVEPNGNDSSGTGTQANPWQHLSYACGRVTTPGDAIWVNAGTYTDNTTCNLSLGVKIQGAGKSLVTINTTAGTYISAVSDFPVKDGSNEISGIAFYGNDNTGILSRSRSNQRIHDCRFQKFFPAIDVRGRDNGWSSQCLTTPPPAGATAFYCDDRASLSKEPASTDWAEGVEIYNNELIDAKIYALVIKGAQIHHNTIDNSTTLKSGVGHTALWWNAVEFYNNSIKLQTLAWSTIGLEVWMVENNCKFYNNWTNSWFSILNNPNGPNLPYSWQIVNNVFESDVVPGIGSVAVGQALETTYLTRNVLIEGNYFANMGANLSYGGAIGIWGKGCSENYEIRNNVVYRMRNDAIEINSRDTSGEPFCARNIRIYNNTVEGGSGGVYMPDGPGNIQNIYIKNNIFMNGTYGAIIYPSGHDVTGVEFTNNFVYGGNGYTYDYTNGANVTGAGFSVISSNYNSKPQLNYSGTRPDPYYRPSGAKSNVVDKGIDMGVPYSGSAPDIGAYEYTGTTPTPPSPPKDLRMR